MLGGDVGGEAVMLGGMRFLGLLAEIARVVNRAEILAARYRIEVHAVEIGDDHLVACRAERVHGRPRHRAVEAPLLGMGMDDEDAHRSLRRALSAGAWRGRR